MPESAFTEGGLIAGRYRLDALLGEGGMGEVWAATHTVTRRAVALKFLKPSVRDKGGLRQRFLREASTASALKHPHVVEVLDVFDFEERAPVLVMELLEGETLGTKLARDGRLCLEETAALLLPVCSAVGTAHALGIIHRDLKPENIFLARVEDQTRVKVLDFGIAKLTAEHYLEGGRSALITDTGSMLGTPCYMAPEQAMGETSADYRADIWSLGVILYECLSGTRPIEGENLPQVVARLVSAGIIPLERLAPDLPHQVTALVTQMLSRERTRRPRSLEEISQVLGYYTTFRAPGFGAPSVEAPPSVPQSGPRETLRPRARLVASRDADPQGATMLSTPPVGSSVAIESTPTPARPRRTLQAILALVAIVLATLGLSSLGVFGSSERASRNEPSAASVPVVVAAPAPELALTTDGPATPPSASIAAKPASAQRKATAKSVVVKKSRSGPSATAPKGETDEGNLFPGRK
jgi:serine/threonine protein kinase